MKKEEFFLQVVKEVKKLKITQVIGKYIEIRQRGFSDADALCPFHEDLRMGSFKISDRKGIFKCFSCGAFGDGISFVQRYFDISFHDAVFKIARDQGIISETDHDALSRIIRPVQQHRQQKVNGITPVATPHTRHVAYSLFLENTRLSEEHREYLKNRGFSDKEIDERKFFTFPDPTKDFLKELYRTLKRYKVSPNVFKKVPGFFTHPKWETGCVNPRTGEKEYYYKFARFQGIGIPVWNAMGMIVGIQIRKNIIGGSGSKYLWFSSSFAGDPENPYIFGTASDAPTHVAAPKKIKYPDVVFITEGYFKAEAIAREFSCVAVSVPGVGNFRSINDDLRQIIHYKTGTPIQYIYIAYDADLSKNPQVFLQSQKLVDFIRESFPDARFFMSVWDERDGKGIDDLILNGKQSTLKRVDFDRFSERYLEVLTALEEKFGAISNIPLEVLEHHYYEKVFQNVI